MTIDATKGEREEALELLLDEFEDAVIAKAESLMVWRRRKGSERDDARQALKDFLLSSSKAAGEMREILQGFLDCPEIAECHPADKDPETEALESRARALLSTKEVGK